MTTSARAENCAWQDNFSVCQSLHSSCFGRVEDLRLSPTPTKRAYIEFIATKITGRWPGKKYNATRNCRVANGLRRAIPSPTNDWPDPCPGWFRIPNRPSTGTGFAERGTDCMPPWSLDPQMQAPVEDLPPSGALSPRVECRHMLRVQSWYILTRIGFQRKLTGCVRFVRTARTTIFAGEKRRR